MFADIPVSQTEAAVSHQAILPDPAAARGAAGYDGIGPVCVRRDAEQLQIRPQLLAYVYVFIHRVSSPTATEK